MNMIATLRIKTKSYGTCIYPAWVYTYPWITPPVLSYPFKELDSIPEWNRGPNLYRSIHMSYIVRGNSLGANLSEPIVFWSHECISREKLFI